jgi:subtilisin-like proprotein convertase family protein
MKKRNLSVVSALLIFGAMFTMGSLWLGPRAARAQQDAPQAVVFSENFDSVTVPELPTGWASTNSGQSLPWVTLSTIPDSPPNAVYANDPEFTGNSSLTTPAISLGNLRHKVTFRHRYQMDYEFDGGVLELSINGGAFTDIVSAGGQFVTGGYDTPLVGGSLAGRNAWTGDSVFYMTTEINLPASTNNQSIRLRWRFGSDNMEGGDGWRIDSVQITNAISGFNGTAIPIPDSGASSNYPSQITVADQFGLVSGVQVTLTNFSHTAPDDVDLVLMSPSGASVILMSDVGGTNPVTNANIVFDDTAGTGLSDTGTITSGTFKPTDFEPGDIFPAPGPAGPATGRMLSAFNGTNGNGSWRLFLVDDSGGNAGSISGGWNIAVQSSPDVISLQSTGAGSIYPSQKLVAGLLGTITNVTVNVTNISHTALSDLDLMLVAPNGRRVMLMSDVGGAGEVGGINLTFDDSAPAGLPVSTSPTSGSYRPTDNEPGDVFPAPAPAGPANAALSTFYGSAPNGQWKLYAVDDTGNTNGGSIAGAWTLNLTTSTTACDFTIGPTGQSFPVSGGTGAFAISMPPACSWTAVSNSSFVTINSAAAGNGDGTVSFTVAPNQGGPRAGSITVSNGYATRVFAIQQPSGCPTSLTHAVTSFPASGGTGTVGVTAGPPCTYMAMSGAPWVQITSTTQTGNGNVTFTVAPNTTGLPRSTNVFVSGQSFAVNQAGASSRRYDFDGDARADLSIYRPSTGVWWIYNSGTPGTVRASPFGIPTDRPVPADYDGDRKSDLAVYRDGVWYSYMSQSDTVRVSNWGNATDTPVPGDADGDGKADLVIYRGAEMNWYILRSSDSAFDVFNFGLAPGDKPLSGDFDGDGRMDLATTLDQQVNKRFAFRYSSNGSTAFPIYGVAGDIAVPADYDGDGDDNMAVFRPSTGWWYTSTDPATNYGAVRFGANGDVPVAADYDGDGKADVAVFRQGVWYILNSSNQSVRIDGWGASGDIGIPGVYNAQ